ncbi:retrotransposon protein, putative, ty1-copia subclass [Tanacetum coccineum]
MDISEEVYMVQPKGFVNPKHSNRVCKLKRSIYGLKEASRQWNKQFDDEIKKFGFTQNRDEPCVYMKASGSNVTFLILYVDDILIMGNHIPMLQDVKSYLGKCFAMKDLGEVAYVFGIKIYRDRSRRLIGLCQSAYIEKILKRFNIENSKRGSIPMQDKPKLCKSQDASTPAEMLMTLKAEYIVALDTSKEDVWIRKFIYGFSFLPTNEVPTKMYCDNTEAITIANEPVITKDDNGVDPFTKALPFNKNSEHTKNIGKTKLAYAPMSKIPRPPKKHNPAKYATCRQFGEVGHWRRNCPQYLAELMNLKKLSQGASTSGNGHRASLEAIGTFHLFSLLKDNGFVNCFIDNGISISRDGLLYFHAILLDGIYEIDLHCGNSNDSSIYASGKMRRKPFSHQLERANNLLGLIHTDVYGPFRTVSRQGASYFVTFTDDFSRYSCVYLLKHKHEVFETIKVFQKEVENQLGKTIKLQHFDRASEYMSQEFLDHLKEHGIITHRTPPYTPQHNGVSKRKDRTLLDMHELGDLNKHANYKAALLDPEYEKWLAAMNVEMVDYEEETLFIVSRHLAIRILIAIAAFYDYEIWQMDVKTAFLNGHLFKEVYMVKLEGFVNPKCKLKRSIYRLKQASRQWNK